MMVLALAVLTVLLVSAICSGTEAAFFSVTKIQAKQAQQAGKFGANSLIAVLDDLTRPIAAIVIINNPITARSSIHQRHQLISLATARALHGSPDLHRRLKRTDRIQPRVEDPSLHLIRPPRG